MKLFKDLFTENFNFDENHTTSFLCKQNNSRKKIFVSSVILPIEHMEQVKGDLLSKLDLPITTFELEKEADDNIYKFTDSENLSFYKEIINYFISTTEDGTNNSDKEIIISEQIPSARDLKFIIHQFEVNENKILVFSRQNRISLNSKKNIFHFRNNADFTLVDDKEYYMFNPNVTCVFVNNDVYVVDYKGFIEIFNYKEYLKDRVSKVIEILENDGIIQNIESYKEEIGKYRYFNSLTKIDPNGSNIKSFINTHKKTIKHISNNYDVKFSFDDTSNSFIVEEEDGLKLIIRIISERAGFDFKNELITFPIKEAVNRK